LGVEHRAVHLILQDEDLYPYHYSWVQSLCLMIIIIVSNTASGFYGNMNMIRASWSTSYGRTKQYSHVSSTVTTVTCGHSIIPM
jgi:hypothetical protein